MTNIDLPDRAPPARPPQKPLQRPAPCAGLFGWRKTVRSDTDTPKDKTPGDYPLV